MTKVVKVGRPLNCVAFRTGGRVGEGLPQRACQGTTSTQGGKVRPVYRHSHPPVLFLMLWLRPDWQGHRRLVGLRLGRRECNSRSTVHKPWKARRGQSILLRPPLTSSPFQVSRAEPSCIPFPSTRGLGLVLPILIPILILPKLVTPHRHIAEILGGTRGLIAHEEPRKKRSRGKKVKTTTVQNGFMQHNTTR